MSGLLTRRPRYLDYLVPHRCRELGALQLVGNGFVWLHLSLLYDLSEEPAVAFACISFVLSLGLYLASLRKGARLASAGGAIGQSVIYDFFMGRELKLRLSTLDLEFVCELRSGLIG